MTSVVLVTDRLHSGDWRDLSGDDLAALFTPEVVEFLPEGFHGCTTETDQKAFLTAMSQQAEVLALYDEQKNSVGLLILSLTSEEGTDRHLGYLFAQRFWGQGLATELIAGVQKWFRGTDVNLSGGVMHGNTASARLLQRAGFQSEACGDEVIYRWSGR